MSLFYSTRKHSRNELEMEIDLTSFRQPDQKHEETKPNHDAVDRYFRKSTWIQNSVPLSTKPAIEQSISALQTYEGKVTPHLHELLGQRKASRISRELS